jgi:molybdenum cofactor cytidylyltransferase
VIAGLLLAAGSASRFGSNKLLADLGNGRCVAEAACLALLPAVDRLLAVVRPGSEELAQRLAAAGAEISSCPTADQGMGASLTHGIATLADADGWLVALADMPLLASPDAQAVADALRGGARIAVPVAGGRRGHPVGFARSLRAELMALTGDIGARSLLARHIEHVIEIPVADALSWQDVDSPADLAAARHLLKAGTPR